MSRRDPCAPLLRLRILPKADPPVSNEKAQEAASASSGLRTLRKPRRCRVRERVCPSLYARPAATSSGLAYRPSLFLSEVHWSPTVARPQAKPSRRNHEDGDWIDIHD